MWLQQQQRMLLRKSSGMSIFEENLQNFLKSFKPRQMRMEISGEKRFGRREIVIYGKKSE
jgi:uncharacterized Rmd1/YagE family protein